MHGQFYTDTVGPGSTDHLALTTAFACTVGWSLKPGFTVYRKVGRSLKKLGLSGTYMYEETTNCMLLPNVGSGVSYDVAHHSV